MSSKWLCVFFIDVHHKVPNKSPARTQKHNEAVKKLVLLAACINEQNAWGVHSPMFFWLWYLAMSPISPWQWHHETRNTTTNNSIVRLRIHGFRLRVWVTIIPTCTWLVEHHATNQSHVSFTGCTSGGKHFKQVSSFYYCSQPLCYSTLHGRHLANPEMIPPFKQWDKHGNSWLDHAASLQDLFQLSPTMWAGPVVVAGAWDVPSRNQQMSFAKRRGLQQTSSYGLLALRLRCEDSVLVGYCALSQESKSQ